MPIPGYEGIYDISSLGRVRSYPRNGTRAKTLHILRPSISRRGYYRVSLFKNDKVKYYSIHRLVAEAFLQRGPDQTEVNHKDGNPSNNLVSNLEWCSRSENHKHRVYFLGHNPLIPCRRVKCIELGETYPSAREAGKSTGIDYSSIIKNIKGKYAHAGGFHWEYA